MNRLPAKAMPIVAAERQREADVEAVWCGSPLRAHVADRVDRIDDPQPGRRPARTACRAARPRRRARSPAAISSSVSAGPRAGEHRTGAGARPRSAQQRGGRQRDRLAQIRPAVEQRRSAAAPTSGTASASSISVSGASGSLDALRAGRARPALRDATPRRACRGRSRSSPPARTSTGTSMRQRRVLAPAGAWTDGSRK